MYNESNAVATNGSVKTRVFLSLGTILTPPKFGTKVQNKGTVRCLTPVSSSVTLMDHYYLSLCVVTFTVVSNKYPSTGEQVIKTFLYVVTIATL